MHQEGSLILRDRSRLVGAVVRHVGFEPVKSMLQVQMESRSVLSGSFRRRAFGLRLEQLCAGNPTGDHKLHFTAMASFLSILEIVKAFPGWQT